MRVKVIGLLAVLALVSACASEPEEAATATDTGSSQSQSTGGTSEPAPAPSTTLEAPAPGSVEQFQVEVGDRVFFAFDRSDLSEAARATLNKQAEWLKTYPAVTIRIEGHADERGTREYNLALGARRANSVKEYLISQGVNPNRIDTISYGKERPAVEGSNEAAWAQNRRGVTTLVGGYSS